MLHIEAMKRMEQAIDEMYLKEIERRMRFYDTIILCHKHGLMLNHIEKIKQKFYNFGGKLTCRTCMLKEKLKTKHNA